MNPITVMRLLLWVALAYLGIVGGHREKYSIRIPARQTAASHSAVAAIFGLGRVKHARVVVAMFRARLSIAQFAHA